MAEKWITYYRPHHSTGEETTITRLESERVPLQSSWQKRPSTATEIATELAKRAEKERELTILRAFEARPEYIAAASIRNALEWMSPEDHPLDRLSADEWEQLRKKLCE